MADTDSGAHVSTPCGEPGGVGSLPEPIASAYRRAPSLTPRERAVFRRLGAGHDNRTIARELHISERTVKRYVTAILAKLMLRSRLQAGLCALLLSWTGDGEVGSKGSFLGECPEGPMEPGSVPGEDISVYSCSAIPGETKEPTTMAFDALAALRAAGNPVDLLTTEQRGVLAQLTEDEVAVLNSVKERLDAVSEADVEGHIAIKIA